MNACLARLLLALALVLVGGWGRGGPAELSGTEAAESPAQTAGPTETGFLLPNGWHLTPAGRHVLTSDMLLNIEPLSDSRHAIVTCSGFNEHFIGVVNLDEGRLVSQQPAYQSWFGLAVSADEQRVWWAGGGEGRIHEFHLHGNQISRIGEPSPQPLELSLPEIEKLKARYASERFRGGLCIDSVNQRLFSLETNAGRLLITPLPAALDRDGPGHTADAGSERVVEIGGRPYDVQLAADGRQAYVSDWAGSRVVVVDTLQLQVVDRIPVGEHPNRLTLTPDGRRLFVACGSTNAVWAIDTLRGTVSEIISTSLFPNAPEGSTPDAVAVSPDGTRLFVANADNNCVAVVDITKPSRSTVKGFIPTGWYPTSVAVTPDGNRLLVGVGKGLQTRPNPLYADDLDESTLTELERFIKQLMPFPYIGTQMSGSLSIIDMPSDDALEELTSQVYENCPYAGELLAVEPPPNASVIPTRVGDPCPRETRGRRQPRPSVERDRDLCDSG